MTREEIINEIKCLLSELNNGEDAVSYLTQNDVKWLNENIKALEQEPKTGHWGRKTKVDAYDIAGVKTWGIKCQCDKCDFTTTVVEDFGYYKFCPNCGAKMESGE